MYAYWITVNYREAYHLFACNGILFNHESPLRGETFVTRKITRAVSKMALGLQDTTFLGNLDSKRDWGHAKDFVKGMWLILQQDKAQDFVLATGITTSIRDFVCMAFREVGVEIEFRGEGVNEIGLVKSTTNSSYKFKIDQKVVQIDPNYFRPTEVDLLIGDASKAQEKLNWKPEYTLSSLIKEMIQADLKLFQKDTYLLEGGHGILKRTE